MTIKQTGGIFGRNPTFNDVDIDGDLTVAGDLTVQGTTITVDSATAQSIVLGDNDKMTFGAGSDLQIYHTGGQSVIEDAGQGNLVILATDFYLNNSANTENMITALNNGAVKLFYDNAPKLTTTSTGVDVTGTITSDGLTVDGTATIGNLYNWTFDDSTLGAGASLSAATTVHFGTTGNNSFVTYTNANRRLAISNGGDVSFYEDTGTTPKMVWKSAEERLGIGTDSPQNALDIASGVFRVYGSGAAADLRLTSSGNDATINAAGTGSASLVMQTGGTERLRITSDGSVGIGTDSPSEKLHIVATSGDIVRFQANVGSGTGYLYADSSGAGVYSGASLSDTGIYMIPNSRMDFRVNGSERMRITSDGDLLVGTASNTAIAGFSGGSVGLAISSAVPTIALVDNEDSVNDISWIANSAGDLYISNKNTSGNIRFSNAGSEAMRIDSSGNVGIGLAPENSSGTWRNFEQGGMNLVGRSAGGVDGMIGTNYVFKTDNSEVYKYSAASSRMFFNDSEIILQQAGSGTEGTAIS